MSEVNGKIKFIGTTQNVSASFKKREVVVTTEEQYPQHILIEFTQDKCDVLDNYQVGQNVKVGINLRGREWVNPQGETRYFNSIQGWNISKTDSNATTIAPVQEMPETNFKEEEHDDLPF
jgi:hypothetical protein